MIPGLPKNTRSLFHSFVKNSNAMKLKLLMISVIYFRVSMLRSRQHLLPFMCKICFQRVQQVIKTVSTKTVFDCFQDSVCFRHNTRKLSRFRSSGNYSNEISFNDTNTRECEKVYFNGQVIYCWAMISKLFVLVSFFKNSEIYFYILRWFSVKKDITIQNHNR